MPRGGARPGSGPKRRLPQIEYLASVTPQQRAWAVLLVEKLENPKDCDEQYVTGWRTLWDAQDLRIRLDTRRYLYDQAYGKAVERKVEQTELSGQVTIEHAGFDPTKLSETELAEAERLIQSAFARTDSR